MYLIPLGGAEIGLEGGAHTRTAVGVHPQEHVRTHALTDRVDPNGGHSRGDSDRGHAARVPSLV
jgi:hypothetical protein